MPFEVRQTVVFAEWFAALRDRRGADRILARILRAQEGNLGDVKYFSGIGEMRIDCGPGYRVYFVRRGAELIFLLCGGDKDDQKRDIKRAEAMAMEV